MLHMDHVSVAASLWHHPRHNCLLLLLPQAKMHQLWLYCLRPTHWGSSSSRLWSQQDGNIFLNTACLHIWYAFCSICDKKKKVTKCSFKFIFVRFVFSQHKHNNYFILLECGMRFDCSLGNANMSFHT